MPPATPTATGTGLASSPSSTALQAYEVGGAPIAWAVCPGDRFSIQNVQISEPASLLGYALQPDADNMLPYLQYKPRFSRLADYKASARERTSAAFGNSPTPPKIRYSLSESIYCPWEGEIIVTGGAKVTGSPSTWLAVTAIWSRTPRAERPDANRLALYNAQTVDGAGNPVRIARPDFARALWTPDQHTVVLDFGPGTPSATQSVDFAVSIDFGPYPYFYFPVLPAPAIAMIGIEV